MGRIVLSVILLVVLTVLIVLNLGPTTPVNLLGARFEKVPIVAVALLSFALGVVYSFLLYIGRYFHRASRKRLEKRHQDVSEREKKLAGETGGDQMAADPVPATPSPEEKKGSAVSRFFRKFL